MPDIAEILLLQVVLAALMWAGVSLFWGPLSSDASLKQFGLWPSGKPKVRQYEDKARSDGRTVDLIGCALLLASSTLILYLFGLPQGDLSKLVRDRTFQLASGLCSLAVLLYHSLIGPRKIARSQMSQLSFRQHVVPQLASLPFDFAVWSATVPLTIFAILRGVSMDLTQIDSLEAPIHAMVGGYSISSTTVLQRAAVLVVGLGSFMTEVSQKYVTTGWLVLLLVVLIQLTRISGTISSSSIDLAKCAAWVVFFTSIGFGMLRLPTRYLRLHVAVQAALGQAAIRTVEASDLEFLISIQDHLTRHDLQWLLLQALTRFNNLIVLLGLGIGLLLRSVLFKNISALDLLRLLLPRAGYRVVNHAVGSLGLDQNPIGSVESARLSQPSRRTLRRLRKRR